MKLVINAMFGLILLCKAATAGNEFAEDLSDIAARDIQNWTQDAVIVAAVRAQNITSVGLSQQDILALDQTWRDETITGGKMIDDVLANSLSAYLRKLQNAGQGQFTEIFVTDVRGLNVGQSSITSDFWQGDEAKWQVPQSTGRMHMGEVEFDESAQRYQSQISLPIIHEGQFIGAITVGIDVEKLASLD